MSPMPVRNATARDNQPMMVCFCHTAPDALALSLAPLAAGASLAATADISASLTCAAAARVTLVANWAATRLLPSAPWTPDPAWLKLNLPTPQLSISAMATLSALAQLRAQAVAQLGLDPLLPAAALPLARLVITLNARLPGLALSLGSIDPLPYIRLAAVASAAMRVQAAIDAGLFAKTDLELDAYLNPGGIPLATWQPFIAKISALAPLIAVSLQMEASADISLLAKAMLSLKAVVIPPVADLNFALQLTALLGALKTLSLALGVNVATTSLSVLASLTADFAATVAAKIAVNASPPRIALSATLAAPAATVNLAVSAQIAALASLNWQIPVSAQFSLLANLQPALSLAAAMPGLPIAKSPCASGCDASRLVGAALGLG